MPTACDLAERLKAAPARIEGRGTRPGGEPVDAEAVSTLELDRIVAHEPEDFTAVLQPGVAVRDAQAAFAEAGQRLAIDAPGDGTIGGLFATAESGPLRHRYGAPRDLIIGIELALSDGTVARGGGRVIKNVAGYDLPKLVTGSHGTLGLITEVAVRLHPLPETFATAVLRGDSPEALQRLALECTSLPLEAESIDVRWDGSEGAILVRFAGATASERAARVGTNRWSEVVEDDAELWGQQRERQRGEGVVRVTHLPTQLAQVLESATEAVGRAGVGTTWVRGSDHVAADLAKRPEYGLMRAVKERFDPSNHCNPGRLL